MKFVELQKKLENVPIFSAMQLTLLFGSHALKRMVDWQKKNYVQRLRNNYYCFPQKELDELFLFLVANKIYTPSYISLESMLSWYGIIPEGVYITTSITTAKTNTFITPIGRFDYAHIKKNLFFGYTLLAYKGHGICVADMEKTILDYLYLKSKVDHIEVFQGLRWNQTVLQSIDETKMNRYLAIFNSKALNKRIQILKNYYA